jgi:L-ascorbate 6-phosphate lactonase
VKTGHALIEDIDTCSPQRGQCAFWWLGQQGYVIKLGTTVCYVDAYLDRKSVV